MSIDDTQEQQDLPPQTAPENIPVSLRGFRDEATAQQFGGLIAETVRAVSRYANLERLDGLTIAYDYDDALAQLDRGYQTTFVLRRTATEEIAGVAMTPAVMRNGTVKAHIVFNAHHVLGLQGAHDSDEFRLALYIVAHECGHVDDLRSRDIAFPNTILQRQITDHLDATLERRSSGLWEEYAACRLSAPFGPLQTALYEESLVSNDSSAPENIRAAIRAYRLHADLGQVLEEAGNLICRPLQIVAYLLGHLDGIGADLSAVPQVRHGIEGSSFEVFVTRLHNALQDLWNRRGAWQSLAEFDILRGLVRELYADSGMILSRRPNGQMHVAIPFTPETMP